MALTTAVKALKVNEKAARDELLREAALMALFDHPNIVAIIGVVTSPQNMPALLVLEFCEHGTLLQHVKKAQSLQTAMLLTYCHDVSCGLRYIASRRIVHRDIAARNVRI